MPDPLNEKLAKGVTASRLDDPYAFEGLDIGDDAVLAGAPMPEPSEYLSAGQCDGKPLGADLVYRETWQWLDECGCTAFISKRLIESCVQTFARYVQCEEGTSKFGLPGKHTITGAAIASPFVAMSESFGKQANVYRYEIFDIVRANCASDYSGAAPADDVTE